MKESTPLIASTSPPPLFTPAQPLFPRSYLCIQVWRKVCGREVVVDTADGVADGRKVVLPAEEAGADHLDDVVKAGVGMEPRPLSAQLADLGGG